VILTPAALVRLGALIVATVVLQLSGLGPIQILGGHFDFVPLLVAAIGLYAGSVPGAATGFATGVFLDLSLGQDMGASALVLTAVGYSVGRFREMRDPSHSLAPIAVGALATAAYLLAFAAVSFMLQFDASVSALVLRDILLTTILNAIIALPVFAAVRRVMGPSLAVDPSELRRRRRPPQEAGPIGLRGLSVDR
jgi:rod shape-determining protein MreD